jgi:hypothetical protein
MLVRRLWAGSGALAVALFGCGLVFGDLLGSANYPPLNASARRLSAYFLTNGSEVRALAFFHLLAAVALACFAAYLSRWPRTTQPPAGSLSGLALAGGATAGAFLLLSALVYRALAEGDVVREHALVVLSYLAGGPGSGWCSPAPYLSASSEARSSCGACASPRETRSRRSQLARGAPTRSAPAT